MSVEPNWQLDPGLLRRTFRLALRGRFGAAPNPRVGAVLVQGDRVVGEGFHRAVGEAHAEVEALRRAGDAARGATVYVNLEPCAHFGRTPPCVDALIEAGVARVVASHRDPNPRVSGAGFERLRKAGIEVHIGALAREAVAVNLPFLLTHLEKRPSVTLKWAMSLDGRIATASGESQWISSPSGRRWALELREEHDAILVGSGTALEDDPRLDRRLGKAKGPIVRVVLDRRLRLPPSARLFEIDGLVLIYTESDSRSRAAELESRGATVVGLERVTPSAVLADLAERGVSSLLVEGGGEVIAAFVDAGSFDRVAVCCAPLLIGGRLAPGPLGGEGATRLADAYRLDRPDVRRRGPDVIVSGIREGLLDRLVSRLEV